MYLYSVSGLHSAIRASETYQELTTRTKAPMHGNLLIDKCVVFVHTIILKNLPNIKNGDSIESVRLSRQTLADQLGRWVYIDAVKQILTELGVIYTNEYYSFKGFNPYKEARVKSYIITKEWVSNGIVQVGALDQRTEKKFKNWKKKRYKQLLNNRSYNASLRKKIEKSII